jgi:hypothetical protein
MTAADGKFYFQVDRRQLVYLKFILEAYEGQSTLSTVDQQQGIVVLTIPAPFQADMLGLMTALQQEIDLKPVAYNPQPQ